MNQKNQKNYQNLIDALINCNSGEEQSILITHRALIDFDLIETIKKEISFQVEADHPGNVEFLEFLSEQLSEIIHFLDSLIDDNQIKTQQVVQFNTEDKIELLRDILLAVMLTGSDPQVMAPLLEINSSQLNEHFAQLLKELLPYALSKLKPEVAADYAENIGSFSNQISCSAIGNRAVNLEIAIAGYEAITTVFTRSSFPQEWGKTQYNLGIAYADRIRGEQADNLERAILCFQDALQVRNRELYPEKWADTQHNLGDTYCSRIHGSRLKNLEAAIEAFQQALQVYTEEAYPLDWAGTQRDLGTAYFGRIQGDKFENLELAIICCKNALQVLSCEEFPIEWADTQIDLGLAFLKRIIGDRSENIEQAIFCFQSALNIYTRDELPQRWATVQNNLGLAYFNRLGGNEADNLELAIQAHQAAIEVCIAEELLELLPKNQANLGNAYLHRILGDRSENLQCAIVAYEQTLQTYTRESFPEQWATLQNNIGRAYQLLENFDLAITYCQLALQIHTPEDFPIECLRTARNLGDSAFLSEQWTTAIQGYEIAVNAVEQSWTWAESNQRRQEILSESIYVYIMTVQTCIKLNQLTKALEYVERSKTRNLTDMLTRRPIYPKGSFSQTVLDELERLRQQIAMEQQDLEIRASVSHLIVEGNNPYQNNQQTTLPNRTHLNQLQQQLEQLIAHEITPIDPTFCLTQKIASISYKQIQKLTNDQAAILEWYITGDNFLTFIILPQAVTPILWQSSSENLEALKNLADNYLNTYLQNKTQWQQNLPLFLEQLAEILHLKELLAYIPETVKQLVLIPHLFLHLLPLHALAAQLQSVEVEGKTRLPTGGCLLDLFPDGVKYAPSCQLLQQAQARLRSEFNRFFALQNPTEDLSYTNLEVQAIQKYFQSRHILIKNDAKKANLKLNERSRKSLHTANCIHFSCHGYFNIVNPLLSALLLADCYVPEECKPNSNYYIHLKIQDNQVIDLQKCLTLADLFTLDLNKCRLVTLSACETGLTDFRSLSDEYIGLPSGFLIAGASVVVNSLWVVSDSSTAFLMAKFYENLQNQTSVAIALNQAQLWLRDITGAKLWQWIQEKQLPLDPTQQLHLRRIPANSKPFQHPFHWAGFCVIGQ
ncbi:CHAT domain-containing protein [Nostoc sp. FACHB-87]|uniref:CHAT domain-containing protein n=1 Tax=Nostocaceae TaxID=1162 RepID=UPI0016839FFC|nr:MULTISPECIES: CHAT domain-containing tetratricopeptide repeat protein [Nostocaceae]MBD2457072.1 CHAT domain-containing protein [Nostoc sp. FACHB-87]MBD2478258.1 CHAT domain-containing protein [Anabaena sp. FACHB-83]